MAETLKLLVLEGAGPSREPRERALERRVDRSATLNAIASSGVKVRHDSGGRLVVIEAQEEAEKALLERLPGARLVPVDSDVRDLITDLDSNESLFVEALKIRTSKSYREAKSRRKIGETPEEQELISAPDFRGDF